MKPIHSHKFPKVLPPHIEAITGPVPRARNEVNGWMFRSAILLRHNLSLKEIFELFRAAVARHGHHVTDCEIRVSVESAARSTIGKQILEPLTWGGSEWPEFDRAAAQRIVASVDIPLSLLCANSSHLELPVGNKSLAAAIVQSLFHHHRPICAGYSLDSMYCDTLETWQEEIWQSQFIVPSPLDALTCVKQKGSASTICAQNIEGRCFLVIEFARFSLDEQAAILIHLAERYSLALVVDSGRSSLEGWYYVAGCPEDELHDFMRYAVSVGAERRTWSPWEPVRTPGGTRYGVSWGRIQSVRYFNPNYTSYYGLYQ